MHEVFLRVLRGENISNLIAIAIFYLCNLWLQSSFSVSSAAIIVAKMNKDATKVAIILFHAMV